MTDYVKIIMHYRTLMELMTAKVQIIMQNKSQTTANDQISATVCITQCNKNTATDNLLYKLQRILNKKWMQIITIKAWMS